MSKEITVNDFPVTHFPNEKNLENSVLSFSKEKIVSGGSQNLYPKRKETLCTHIKSNVKLPPRYECETCNKIFTNKTKFTTHCRRHTGEKPFSCDVCGKAYSDKKMLCLHLQNSHVHTGDTPFTCEVCQKTYRTVYNLDLILRIHSKEPKRFVCGICGKSFSKNFLLKTHNRSHTGERPFTCDICGKKFRYRYEMTVHHLSHTGEKPFKCIVCAKGFAIAWRYKVHLRTHTGEKPFDCDICGKAFSERKYVVKHHKIHEKAQSLLLQEVKNNETYHSSI